MDLQRQHNWYVAHRLSLEFEEIMYDPFWRVEDVRSSGIKTKIAHFSTPGRVMHLLSQNELWMYLDLAQNSDIVETYEQFAIPLDFSLPIAKELGVKHPVYIGSQNVPIIQTIDFVSIRDDGTRVAHPVKQESDALRERTMEKLAIQEAYCELEYIDYQLTTSTELRTVKSESLEAMYRHRNVNPFLKSAFEVWLSNFLGCLSDDRHDRASNILERSALISGVEYQQAASFFYCALWNDRLQMDWKKRLKLELPASDLGIHEHVLVA
ncbi:Transposon Tn7 transposition protein A [Psychromonas ingrahamii 37]|uniref:Transposon Tn7 transposition protein A n=2 Tax=Psychromonas ingrahamii TaxID=357794 RepID=A1SZ91_PSYIN|nr:Transposon Tn7 transposition protein A [Psychromonas ingrahamii 37]